MAGIAKIQVIAADAGIDPAVVAAALAEYVELFRDSRLGWKLVPRDAAGLTEEDHETEEAAQTGAATPAEIRQGVIDIQRGKGRDTQTGQPMKPWNEQTYRKRAKGKDAADEPDQEPFELQPISVQIELPRQRSGRLNL